MNATINGEKHVLDEGMTIAGLLNSLGLSREATVVQRNDDIVARETYGTTALQEGDVLELVRFVGGG